MRVDVMIVQIAPDLHGEELRRDHQSRFAVPLGEPVLGRLGIEGTRWVLVEPDRHADVIGARADRPIGHRECAAARSAAVRHVHELDTGEAEVGDEGVGVPGGIAATKGELHVGPSDARIT